MVESLQRIALGLFKAAVNILIDLDLPGLVVWSGRPAGLHYPASLLVGVIRLLP